MTVVTRCQILRLKCTKFDFGWGSTPDPAGAAYSAPPDPLAPNDRRPCWSVCPAMPLGFLKPRFQMGKWPLAPVSLCCIFPRTYQLFLKKDYATFHKPPFSLIIIFTINLSNLICKIDVCDMLRCSDVTKTRLKKHKS